MTRDDDPLRNALGELFRAAVQAMAPETAAPPSAVQRLASVLGRPPEALRDDPGIARDVVDNLLRGAHDLFADATSDDPARREAAVAALRDLDGRLRALGAPSGLTAAVGLAEAGRAGDTQALADLVRRVADEVTSEPAIRDAVARATGQADPLD